MHGTRISTAAASFLLAALLAASTAGAGVKDNATYQGNKARITVGTIKTKARKCDGEMAASIGEMLSTALAKNPKFIVLASQEEVQELENEIELGRSGKVEGGRAPEGGLMEGADILVTGAVTAFEPEAGGGGGLLGAAKSRVTGGLGIGGNTAEIGMDLKLIDIRSRRILKAVPLEAKSTSWKAGVLGGGWADNLAMAGALGAYSHQPMEKAIRSVLGKCIDEIAKDVPDEYYRYQGNGQYTQEYSAGKSGGGAAAQGSEGGPTGGQTGGGSGAEVQGSGAAAPAAEDMSLYTKYDFVPGDQVLFDDDLSREEAGEFPSRWKLEKGVFEVASLGKTKWILCSNEGEILPKLTALPKKFTFEMDFVDDGKKNTGNHFTVKLLQKDRPYVEFGLYDACCTFVNGPTGRLADKSFDEHLSGGTHTLRMMATATTLKCYVDNVRIANVPAIEGFAPEAILIWCGPDGAPGNSALLGNVRIAAGGKTMREQLDADGKIVTHGILFDVNSAVIKGESYKTLAQIGELLGGDEGLKLSIEGHTDSDGEEAANLALSQKRAAAVKDYLVANYSIPAARLQTKGWGETKPIDKNATPEGKANNRRVELVKL